MLCHNSNNFTNKTPNGNNEWSNAHKKHKPINTFYAVTKNTWLVWQIIKTETKINRKCLSHSFATDSNCISPNYHRKCDGLIVQVKISTEILCQTNIIVWDLNFKWDKFAWNFAEYWFEYAFSWLIDIVSTNVKSESLDRLAIFMLCVHCQRHKTLCNTQHITDLYHQQLIFDIPMYFLQIEQCLTCSKAYSGEWVYLKLVCILIRSIQYQKKKEKRKVNHNHTYK